MKYGCIGEHLTHSFSKEIHNALTDYEYDIREVERESLDNFMQERDFCGINVTIPYKELVIPHLYYIDSAAESIGAVNTVVNRDGRLYGYNTDFYGMCELARHAGIDMSDKKVVILGTGGTSKTAVAVAKHLGAREVLRVSRTAREDAIDYAELYARHTDAEVIINTTPSGMFPEIYAQPIELSKFDRLTGVLDAIYNPLRSSLVLEALERGIAAEGGLYMLVAQAVRASEIFLGKKYPSGTSERVYESILKSKENIVLIGMPASGKTTVAGILSQLSGRDLTDTDDVIREISGMDIPTIFAERGERIFRDIETEAVMTSAKKSGRIIATGGGAILRDENVRALRMNGRLYFIDRPLESLIPTADRPLSSDRAAIEERYAERYPIYRAVCDVRIDASTDVCTVASKIFEDFK